MIYCLYGTEKILMENFIKNEISKNKINNVSRYNLDEYSISDILSDASYIDLFSEDKAIIVSSKDLLKKDSELLESYLLNPNEKTHLFLMTEVLDERKKVTKLLKERYKVHEFNKLKRNDFSLYIRNSFKSDGYEIKNDALELFLNNIGNNTNLVYSEIEKLKLYKMDEKVINMSDIKNVVKRECETDVFKLADAVLSNNKEKMLFYYKDLIMAGEDESRLVIFLSGEFRLLLRTKILLYNGYKESDITRELGVHPYRVKLSIERCSRYSREKLMDALRSLYEIDYGIKTGNLPKENSLLNFFLEL